MAFGVLGKTIFSQVVKTDGNFQGGGESAGRLNF